MLAGESGGLDPMGEVCAVWLIGGALGGQREGSYRLHGLKRRFERFESTGDTNQIGGATGASVV